MMCLTARQQLKYAAMAQETFSQHVPGAQGLKGPPVCIIMSGSANANVTVANPLLFSKYFKIEYIYIYPSRAPFFCWFLLGIQSVRVSKGNLSPAKLGLWKMHQRHTLDISGGIRPTAFFHSSCKAWKGTKFPSPHP